MRILFLSLYFQPDYGPGAIRNTLIAQALAQREDVEAVDVITSLPNRWQAQDSAIADEEQDGKLSIVRLPLRWAKRGLVYQIVGFFLFFMAALNHARKNDYDLVYTTSARLGSGVLGALLSRSKCAQYYLDIRDLFLDSISDFNQSLPLRLMMPVLRALFHFSVRRADKVNVLSADFAPDIQKIAPDTPISEFYNGIDADFIVPMGTSAKPDVPEPAIKTILYAGNIGFGQSLHSVVPSISPLLPEGWELKLIGAGRNAVELADRTAALPNVSTHPPVARTALIDSYLDADVLMLQVNDVPAFKKSMPSKFFEYAATRKPILAGTDGFLNRFVDENEIDGVYFFRPNDAASFIEALSRVELKQFDRADFIAQWRRENQVQAMVDDIVATTGR